MEHSFGMLLLSLKIEQSPFSCADAEMIRYASVNSHNRFVLFKSDLEILNLIPKFPQAAVP